MKPTLCRLPAYDGPGLPRPTTSQTGSVTSSAGSGQQGRVTIVARPGADYSAGFSDFGASVSPTSSPSPALSLSLPSSVSPAASASASAIASAPA